jgi:YD repeat-containing protein
MRGPPLRRQARLTGERQMTGRGQSPLDQWGSGSLFNGPAEFAYTWRPNGPNDTSDKTRCTMHMTIFCMALPVRSLASAQVFFRQRLTFFMEERTIRSIRNSISVTDPRANITTSTYDAARGLIATTAPNGLMTAYSYDPDGHVLQLAASTVRGGRKSGSICRFEFIPPPELKKFH